MQNACMQSLSHNYDHNSNYNQPQALAIYSIVHWSLLDSHFSLTFVHTKL